MHVHRYGGCLCREWNEVTFWYFLTLTKALFQARLNCEIKQIIIQSYECTVVTINIWPEVQIVKRPYGGALQLIIINYDVIMKLAWLALLLITVSNKLQVKHLPHLHTLQVMHLHMMCKRNKTFSFFQACIPFKSPNNFTG